MRLLDPGPSRKGWHRLQTVLQCPRKYALYVASKATPGPVSSPALIKGTLLHTALAHHYALKRNPGAGLFSPLGAIEEQVKRQPNAAEWDKHAQLVSQTYLQYELRWAAEQWEVVNVERELVATIHDDDRNEAYLYTQRADLIVRHPQTGLVYIVDHKTTGRLSAKTLRRYTLSGQFRGYNFFGRGLLGDKFGGVVLNMIQWPRGDGDAMFQRSDLEPAPHADKTFRDTVIHAERLIRDMTPKYDDPMAWPGVHHETACWTPYGPCDNHARCEWGTE